MASSFVSRLGQIKNIILPLLSFCAVGVMLHALIVISNFSDREVNLAAEIYFVGFNFPQGRVLHLMLQANKYVICTKQFHGWSFIKRVLFIDDCCVYLTWIVIKTTNNNKCTTLNTHIVVTFRTTRFNQAKMNLMSKSVIKCDRVGVHVNYTFSSDRLS